MKHSPTTRTRAAAGVLAVALLTSSFACGQEPLGPPDPRLRVELSVGRALFTHSDPVHVRFTLFNPTDETIEIPYQHVGDDGGLELPRSLVFGTGARPALYLTYSTERPAPLLQRQAPAEGEARVLRLGPMSSIGKSLELRELDNRLRYTGQFALEWRPWGMEGPEASVEFRVESRKIAVLVTDYGKLTFNLMYDQAPRNVENLLELVRDRFYDGLLIHRIVPGFLIQGGSPDGTSGAVRPDGKTVPAEFHPHAIRPGTLAMALRGDAPDSASCQFFVALQRLPDLDGKYTVVGQADDDESLRTLKRLAEIPTDARYRPQRPVTIRFFTLLDAPTTSRSERLEISRP